VSRSFGGFLRGQAILGVVYAAVAIVTSAVLHLDYVGVTAAMSGFLMAIPFFGPFVAWAPPVVVAFLTNSGSALPAFVLMGVGWLIVMNVLQPRLMQESVGIHPIVVLGSVLIGSKVAGIAGAIFGIPIAAVISAFFFHYLAMTRDTAPVAERAAKRVEKREGRPVRIPPAKCRRSSPCGSGSTRPSGARSSRRRRAASRATRRRLRDSTRSRCRACRGRAAALRAASAVWCRA